MISIPILAQRIDEYSILIKEGMLEVISQYLEDWDRNTLIVIIADENVAPLYAQKLARHLQNAKFSTQTLTIADGESSKSLDVAANLISQFVTLGVKRRDILLALGGGVITDLVGFVAATYMRGIPYINVPTTLVAQLDASIGGKVAVDHRRGKNLLGAFWQPYAVYIDPETLFTLHVDEIRNGLAEAIKVAIIHSEALFEFIETDYSFLLQKRISYLTRLVTETAKAKVELLAPDPYEVDLKRVLNFGHSIGHVLETLNEYNRLFCHGRAISVGMATATRIAAAKGICSHQVAERILSLFVNVGLPIEASDIDHASFVDAFQVIRSIRNGSLNFVLPEKIGSCSVLSDIPIDLVFQNLRNDS